MFGYKLSAFLQQVQIPRRELDSFGDIFSDFLGIIPPALIIQVCLAGGLLLAGMFYFIYRRRRRAQIAQAATDTSTLNPYQADPFEAAPPAARKVNTGALPDLDLLLDPSTLSEADGPSEAPAWPPLRQPRPDAHIVRLHTGHTTEAKELLSILRDVDDNRLIIQMGDTAYRTLLESPEAKKEFTRIMRELTDVVTQPDPRPTPAPAEPEADQQPVQPAPSAPPPAQPGEIPNLGELLNMPARSQTPPPPIGPEGEMPGDLPTYRLDDNPIKVKSGLFGRKKYEADPVPELNIASAIEAYLQHKLRHTPTYAGREIHVHRSTSGGVSIQVDNQFYDAVGDIEDVEIRDFIAATIQEWQDRQ